MNLRFICLEVKHCKKLIDPVGRNTEGKLKDLYIFKMKHEKFSYKYCSLRNDMKNLLYMSPKESLADIEITCVENQGIFLNVYRN
jgi:hypothetical protein